MQREDKIFMGIWAGLIFIEILVVIFIAVPTLSIVKVSHAGSDPIQFTVKADPFDLGEINSTISNVNNDIFFDFGDYIAVVKRPDGWEKNIEFDVSRKGDLDFEVSNITLRDDFKNDIQECLFSAAKIECLDNISEKEKIEPTKFKSEIENANVYPISSEAKSVQISRQSINIFLNESVTISLGKDYAGESIKFGFNTINFSFRTGEKFIIDKVLALYGDGTQTKARLFNPSITAWGTENLTSDQASGNKFKQKICPSPNRNESLLISQGDVAGNFWVQVLNGTTEEKWLNQTTVINNVNFSYIDCAYDNESFGYIARVNSSSVMDFKMYNYTAKTWINLSAPGNCWTGTSGAALELTSSQNDKRILLQCRTHRDGNISYQVYNGTGWQSQIFPSNKTDISLKVGSSCDWDPESGNFYCVFNNGTTGNFSMLELNNSNQWAKLGSFGIENRTNTTVLMAKIKFSPQGRYAIVVLGLNDTQDSTNGTIVAYFFDSRLRTILLGSGMQLLNIPSSATGYQTLKLQLGRRVDAPTIRPSPAIPFGIAWKYMFANDTNGTGSCPTQTNIGCYQQGWFTWLNGSAFALTETAFIRQNDMNDYTKSNISWLGLGPGITPYAIQSTVLTASNEIAYEVDMDTYINSENNRGGRSLGMMCITDNQADLTCWQFNETITKAATELETALISIVGNNAGVSFWRVDNLTPVWDRVTDDSDDNAINNTESISLRATLIDNYRLDKCWLETNETGIWENKTGTITRLNRTAVMQNCTFSWSNSSITSNTTVGWKIWFNDTQGCINSNNPVCGYNYTPNSSFNVIAAAVGISILNQSRECGSIYTEDSAGGTTNWDNPGNAKTSDDNDASITALALNAESDYLKALNCSFNLPSNASILGISVNMERSQVLGTILDGEARLVRNNITELVGDHSNTTNWPGSDTFTRYGNASDLWSATWTYSDINNPAFGFAISANATILGTPQIDYINITVFYNESLVVTDFGICTLLGHPISVPCHDSLLAGKTGAWTSISVLNTTILPPYALGMLRCDIPVSVQCDFTGIA